ncbi:hypothetical protein BJY04DRAFT_192639 [Aspergillus karnatakaensis]|uniref:uncharacterized protein n=1 Tax=Aspergillus karnatakaensis TaxID=1810916 RepID=UPI003CCC8F91
MPSATTTLGWTLANWGPGPTVYEAAASCTQSAIYYAQEDNPEYFLAYESCLPTTTLDCYPEPTDEALLEDYYENWRIVPYWSPGPECPSGWTVVGEAARSGDAAPTSSGIFTQNQLTGGWLGGSLQDILDANVFGSQDALGALLEPNETAIACCPSSMTVGDNGACYSTISDHTISTACYEFYSNPDDNYDFVSTTFVVDGETLTGTVLVPTWSGRLTPTSSKTSTLNDMETSHLVAATTLGPIYYVHKPGDTSDNNTDNNNDDNNSSSSDSDSTSSGSDSSETGSSSEDTPENAAAGVRPGYEGWCQLTGVAGVLVVSLLAGMALVVPW